MVIFEDLTQPLQRVRARKGQTCFTPDSVAETPCTVATAEDGTQVVRSQWLSTSFTLSFFSMSVGCVCGSPPSPFHLRAIASLRTPDVSQLLHCIPQPVSDLLSWV